MKRQGMMSPSAPLAGNPRYERIRAFLNALEPDGDLGATTGEVVIAHKDRIMECLRANPPELGKAESIAAQLALIMDATMSA